MILLSKNEPLNECSNSENKDKHDEVNTTKRRNKSMDTVKLAFINRITKFESLAHGSGRGGF